MMRHLLFDHPLLLPFAEHRLTAIQWAARCAVASGMSIETATGRLAEDMEIEARQQSRQDDDGADENG